jgi:multidrug efflux system membrane fusion protein
LRLRCAASSAGATFTAPTPATAGRNKANSAQAPAPIPVTVAQAKKADFPVYLNGLGAVEPYQTVLIRSRVDGAIVKIAFKQGQMVKQGDVLAQVDPRPYQAALDQALAKKTQDEASLRDAQLNLQRYADLAKRIRFRFSNSTPSRRRSIN